MNLEHVDNKNAAFFDVPSENVKTSKTAFC